MQVGWCRKDFGIEPDALRMECSSKGAVVMLTPLLEYCCGCGCGCQTCTRKRQLLTPNRDCTQVLWH